MSEKKFSRLFAGNHCAKVKFIPNLPSPETVEAEQVEAVEILKKFPISLKGYALWYQLEININTYIFM